MYLRIEGEMLDFQELNEQLKLKPQLIQRKGEKYQIKKYKNKRLNTSGVYFSLPRRATL